MSRHDESNATRRPSRRPAKPPRSRFAPRLEALEGRALLSTLTVLNTDDSGQGSLRAAIAAASSGDTIVFAKNLQGSTIDLSGQITIAKNLNINGPGASSLSIDGQGVGRVFSIGSGSIVAISGLTIQDGLAPIGGGIDNAGALTLNQVVLANNQAIGGLGGGAIYNEYGAGLAIIDSTVTNNVATAGTGYDVAGGGLLNIGTANVDASTFTGNQAVGGNSLDFIGGSVGGAIDNFGGGHLTVYQSSFSGNLAVAAAGPYFGIGGAIDSNSGFHANRPAAALILSSTFHANVATGGNLSTANGGGIDNAGFGSTMTIQDSQVTANRAVGGGDANAVTALGQGIGGGVMNQSGATLDLIDTCVTGNTAQGGKNARITAANPNSGGALGGGVANLFQAVLHVSGGSISCNSALGGNTNWGNGGNALGGGLENTLSALMTVSGTMIQGNTAVAGAGAPGLSLVPSGIASGGGVDDQSNATATINGCTITGNSAIGGSGGSGGAGLGGGVSVGIDALLGPIFPVTSTLTLTNSTLNANLASGGNGGEGGTGGLGFGGGLYVFSRANTTTVATVTTTSIQFNRAIGGRRGSGGTGGLGVGGGVFSFGASLTLVATPSWNYASTSNKNVFKVP